MSGFTYIDGFNLFHGLEEAKLKKFYWLDLHVLSTKILASFGHVAHSTRYFTSRVWNDHDSFKEQQKWLDAVATQKNVEARFGAFRHAPEDCSLCGGRYEKPQEKKTDVCLGVSVLEDLAVWSPSAILLITGDIDQIPTIAAAQRLRPKVPIYIAFPPLRRNGELAGCVGSKRCIDIDSALLTGCCMPDQVNQFISKPANWV